MASYTRQSTFSDGDLITAELFNDEYNQLLAAFENTTGHKHDGTVGEGPVISIIGDAGLATPLNKILIDTTNDHIEFWVDVSGTSTQQLYITDGAILPVTDNDIDLGSNSLQFKDLYINGTANIDNLAADSATLTTADINGGNIDGTVIGATTAAAGTFTTIDASGNVVISGNLTVSGTTTSVNSNEVNIGDNIIVLNSDETGTPSQNAGIEIERGTATNVSLLWNESNDYWTFGADDLNFSDNSKATFGAGNDLQIYSDGATGIIQQVGAGVLLLKGQDFYIQNDAGENFLRAETDGAVRLYYNNAGKLDTTNTGIDVTGTVTSDGFTVDATGSLASNSGNLELSSSNTGIIYDAQNGYHTFKRNGTNALQINGATGDISFYEDTGTTAKFFWDASAEKLGIGTTSPARTTVINSSGTSTLQITNDTTGVGITDGLQIKHYTGGQTQIWNYENSYIAFGTNNLERARIDSSGNLLVGKTASDGTVIGAELRNNGIITSTVSGNVCGNFNRKTSDGTILNFQKDGSTVGSIGTVAGYLGIANGDTGLLFRQPYDDILPYSSTANTAIDNTIDLGDPSFKFKDLYLSGTANFGSLSDGTITITGFVDEDNMSSNSATLVPTQQSVKAYVDSQISSAGGNGISFEDDEKAQFGDGNDLQIYHDGSTSYILDNGVGDLQLRSNNRIIIAKSPFEYMADFNVDGAVDLYYDNSKKLATTSSGINVTGTVTADGLTVSTAGNLTALLDSTSGTPKLQFRSGSGTLSSFIQGGVGGTANLSFQTNGTTERMAIEANGDISFYDDTGSTQGLFWDASAERLGLGTTSPTSKLEVKSSGSNADEISLVHSGNTVKIASLGQESSHGSLILRSNGGVNQVRLSAGGNSSYILGSNFGIGTSSPDGNLEVVTSTVVSGVSDTVNNVLIGLQASNRPTIVLDTADTTYTNRTWNITNVGAVGSLVIGRHGLDVLNLKNDGKVGIGTSSPSSALHIGNAGHILLERGGELRSKDTSSAIRTIARVNGSNELQYGWSSAGAVTFMGGGSYTERMRIHTNGNIGVGTSSPNKLLHINQSGNTIPLLVQTNDHVGIAVKGGNSHDRYISFQQTNGSVGGKIGWDHSSQALKLNAVDTFGSTHLAVDVNGKVGIGTASPSYNLDLLASNAVSMIRTGDTTSPTLGLFVNSGSNGVGTISVDNGGHMTFDTGATGSGQTEAMRIDSSQRVGIGTSSPSTALHVSAPDGNAELILQRTGAAASSWGLKPYNGDFFIRESGTDKVTIKGNGNVGLGTTTPDALLEINKGSEGEYLRVGGDNASNARSLRFTSSTASGSSVGALHTIKANSVGGEIAFANGNGNIMYLDVNRNVGIGTSSPTETLHVMSGVSNDTVAIISGSQSDRGLTISTYASDGRTDGGVDFDAYKSFKFTTDGTERARIDSSGNLLVSKTASSFNAAGAEIRDSGVVIGTVDGAAGLIANRLTSNGTLIQLSKDGTTVGSIGIQSSGLVIDGESAHTGLRFTSAGITPRLNGAESDNTVNLGESGIRFKDLHLSGTANVGGGTLTLGTADSSSGHINAYENMSFNIDVDNDDTNRYFSFHKNGSDGSGSELMRLTEDGRLGIGTTTVGTLHGASYGTTKLHVDGGTDRGQMILEGNTLASIVMSDNGATANSRVFLTQVNDGLMHFKSVNDNGTSKATIMSMTSAGSVGIGTASPQNNLHVNAGTGGGVTLEANVNVDIDFRYRSGGVNKYNVAYDASAGSLIWYDNTANATRMVLNSSGNLGIGTTSPSSLLHLSSSAPVFTLTSTSGNGGTHTIKSTGVNGDALQITAENDIYLNGDNIYFRKANETQHMRLTSTGNLGIGTTSPTQKLSVESSSAGVTRINVTNTGNAAAGAGVQFITKNGATQVSNATLRTDNAGNFSIFTGTTSESEKARIDSSGNLLVGKTSTSFAVAGTQLAYDGAIVATRSANPIITLNRLSTDGELQRFYKDGTQVGSIGTNGGDIYIGTGDTNLLFTDGSDKIIPANTGGASRDGAIDLGGSSTRFKDLHLSGHLKTGGGGSNSTGEIEFVADSTRARIVGGYQGGGGGYLKFHTDTTGGSDLERGRFDNSGNLLVGTTSTNPQSSSSVEGVQIAPDHIGVGRSGNTVLYLNRQTNDGSIISLRKAGSEIGTIGSYASLPFIGKGDTTLLFDDANDHIVPRGTNGGARDNVINLGSSSNRFNDLHLGGTANGNKIHLVNNATDDTVLLESTEDSSSAAPVLTFKRNSGSVADADYLGQLKFKGENDADQEVVYAKITAKIQDASDGTEDGLLEFANKKAGSNVITARLTSDTLKLLNSTSLEVDGSVGIGTTSPVTPLHVSTAKSSVTDSVLTLQDSSTTFGKMIEFVGEGSTDCRGVIGFQEPQGNAPELYISNGGTETTGNGVGLAFWSYTLVDRIAPCDNVGDYRDNAIDLGWSNARFDDIYATNGTIQTSDRNDKQDIQALTDAETRVATACKGLLRRFRWQDAVTEKGDEARYHFGIISQDLQDAFTAEGLDAGDYGMFISETWEDSNGVEQTRLGVRYSELLAFIIAAI